MRNLRRVVKRELLVAIDRRAVALWPGLSSRALARCRHDPARIAALVARRTKLPLVQVYRQLTMPVVTDEEATTWFG